MVTFIVTTASDENDGGNGGTGLSLREALALANTNAGHDTITFDAGLLTGQTINLTLGELAITDHLTLSGLGASNLTIDGNNLSSVLKVDDGDYFALPLEVAIDGLTISGGSTTSDGGGLYNNENVTLSNTTFLNNSAGDEGGAVYNRGTLTVSDSTFSGNSASDDGGGLFNRGNLTLSNANFTGNSASDQGGGLFDRGAATIIGSTFTNNTAGDGGGFFSRGTAAVSDSNFTNNTASFYGGGLHNIGTLNINGTAFSGNAATSGDGGGLYSSGDITVNFSTLSGNNAALNGGGMFNLGTASISASTFSSNTAGQNGGGFSNQGASSIDNSTFNNNLANNDGGGISNDYYGYATLIQNTLSGNTAGNNGGGLASTNGSATYLSNSTVTLNAAGSGGGLFSKDSSTTVTSTIVAGNSADQDLRGQGNGAFTSGGNNLIGNGEYDGEGGEGGEGGSVFTNAVNSDLVGTAASPIAPGLAPLGNNGGPTPTHALFKESIAINAGSNPDYLPTDQRGIINPGNNPGNQPVYQQGIGFDRVDGSGPDIGAYEYRPVVLDVVKTADRPYAQPFERVTYTYRVTTSGGQGIGDLVLVDDNATPNHALDDFNPIFVGGDTDNDGVLDNNETWEYTATIFAAAVMDQYDNGNYVGPAGTQIIEYVNQWGQVIVDGTTTGDIRATFITSEEVNDNRYTDSGDAPTWNRSHTLGSLVGSDKSEFLFTNGDGQVVLDFFLDYIDDDPTAPSGYNSLGVSDGEGGMAVGTEAQVLDSYTSLGRNLNLTDGNGNLIFDPAQVTLNSPAEPNPLWEYRMIYSATVDGDAFGASGFGFFEIASVHNSPNKNGYNVEFPQLSPTTTVNTVVASGTNLLNGEELVATDTATVNVVDTPPPPAVAIETYVDGDDADSLTGPIVSAGGQVTFTYAVTNAGNDPLSSVAVSDDNGTPGDLTDDFIPTFLGGDSNQDGLLNFGETWTYAAQRPALLGQFAGSGKVTSQGPQGQSVTDSDLSHYFGAVEGSGIGFEQLVTVTGLPAQDGDNPIGPVAAISEGDQVTFTYRVTNFGENSLSNLTVSDNNGTVGEASDDFNPAPVLSGGFNVGDLNQNNQFDPGETWEYSQSGTPQLGQQTHLGRATATTPSGEILTDSDLAHYFGVQQRNPAIRVEKFTNGQDATSPISLTAGTDVIWTYEVHNDGNMPLTVTEIVDDFGTITNAADDFSPLPVLSGGFNVGDTNQDNRLDFEEVWQFTSEGVVSYQAEHQPAFNLNLGAATEFGLLVLAGGEVANFKPKDSAIVGDVGYSSGVKATNNELKGFTTLAGTVFVHTQADYAANSNFQPSGGVVSDVATNTRLNQANTDALNLSDQLASLSPDQQFATKIETNLTINSTGQINVIAMDELELKAGEILTLDGRDGASDYFFINVVDLNNSGKTEFILDGGQIQLVDVKPENVIFNFPIEEDIDIPNNGDIVIKNSSIAFGTFLAPAEKVKVDTGTLTGAIIASEFEVNDDPFNLTHAPFLTQYKGSVAVTGQDSRGTVVGDGATNSHYGLELNPYVGVGGNEIAIEQYVSVGGLSPEDADTPIGPVAGIDDGDQLTFTYLVTNSGQNSLNNLAVTDDNGTAGNASDDFQPAPVLTGFGLNVGDLNQNNWLDPGETWEYTASAVPQLGQQTHVSQVSATDLEGGSVTDDDPTYYLGVQQRNPAIRVEKLTNGQDATTAIPLVIGTDVTWTYQVYNDGNMPLTVTEIVDDLGSPSNLADDFNPLPVLSGGFNVGDTNQDNRLDSQEVWQFTSQGAVSYQVQPAFGIGIGEAAKFGVLVLEGGEAANFVLNNSTFVGDIGYGKNVNAPDNRLQDMTTLEGTAFVHSTADYAANINFQPSGGVVRNASTNSRLEQANTDALNASTQLAALPPDQQFANIIDTSLTVNSTGQFNVIEIDELELKAGEILTLDGRDGFNDYFVVNVVDLNNSGKTEFVLDGGEIQLIDVTPEHVIFNFPIEAGTDIPNNGDIEIKNSSIAFGTFLAPAEKVTGDTAALTGSVIASEFEVNGKVFNFTHAPFLSQYEGTVQVTGQDSQGTVVGDGATSSHYGIEAPPEVPTAVDDSATTPQDTAVTVDVLANDSDPNGDILNLESFGAATNGTVSRDDNGTPNLSDDQLIYTPNPNFNGADSFTYTVNDGQGNTDTATVNITVNFVPQVPTAVNDIATTDQDTAVTINVLANDSDPNGDPLNLASFSPATNGTVSLDDNGTSDQSDDQLIYTPNPNFNGTDSFTYTVNDGQGNTDTATVNITVNALTVNTGNNFLIGDSITDVTANQFNIAFVIDVSGSMAWAFDGSSNPPVGESRLDYAQAAFQQFLATSIFNTGIAANSVIRIIPFAGNFPEADRLPETFNPGDYGTVADFQTALNSKIDSLFALGSTHYQPPMRDAAQWFQGTEAIDPTQASNKIYFLSDGYNHDGYDVNADATLTDLYDGDIPNLDIQAFGFGASTTNSFQPDQLDLVELGNGPLPAGVPSDWRTNNQADVAVVVNDNPNRLTDELTANSVSDALTTENSILGSIEDETIFGDNLVMDAANKAAFEATLAADQYTFLANYVQNNLLPGSSNFDQTVFDLNQSVGQADQISAGAGNDLIFAQGGDDLILAGPGSDTILGGDGVDTFAYQSLGDGVDTIVDFEDGIDLIALNPLGVTAGNFNTRVSISAIGSDTQVSVDGNLLATLTGISSGIEQSDFILAV